MIGTAILIISLLLIALVAWAVFPRKPQNRMVAPITQPLLALPIKKQASSPARKQLVSMLNGDTTVADRLIQSVQSLNPAKDINWCIDKALTDLERDRRR